MAWEPAINETEIGVEVKLIFLQLPDAETAIIRVAERVRQGGHHIEEETIRRRFKSGLKNFHDTYKLLVDMWMHFDNAGDAPRLIDWSDNES